MRVADVKKKLCFSVSLLVVYSYQFKKYTHKKIMPLRTVPVAC